MTKKEVEVNVLWDGDAGVFVATSQDVPGLVAEAASLDALLEELKVLVPEMIQENQSLIGRAFDGFLPFRLDVPVLAALSTGEPKRTAG